MSAPTVEPSAFDASWTEARARARLGEPDLVLQKGSPLFGRITVLNYRNQLILSFRDGQLWGAQTVLTGTAP